MKNQRHLDLGENVFLLIQFVSWTYIQSSVRMNTYGYISYTLQYRKGTTVVHFAKINMTDNWHKLFDVTQPFLFANTDNLFSFWSKPISK